MDAVERLRRARLAAQRLTPETACTSAEEAARAVIGVQAQDLRAALARSRPYSRRRACRTAVAYVDGPRHGPPDRGVRSSVAARAAGRAQRPHVRRAL